MAVVDSGRRTSSGAIVWEAAPSSSYSSGSSGGGGSSTKQTYTYKLGDKPPKSSDYSSYKDYSKASYVYSKNKRAVTIARVKAGQSVSSSDLRGAGIQTTGAGGYRYYDSAAKKYITTPPTKAILQQQAEQKEIAELKAATTAKEKQIMILELGIQQGVFSKKAEEKARAHQQELMKNMPEKEPVETAFVIGGKTFVGTYGLKKVYAKPVEKKEPKIFTGIPKIKKDDKPTIPARQKEWEETIDVTTPSPILYTSVGKGLLTEYKAPTGKWAGAMYEFRKGLETKEIKAIREDKMWLADIYGFGSAATYSFRTPESTGQLLTTFGKGAAVGVGVTVLSLTTSPIVPATLLYGGSIYGATQVPKLQEQIAEAKFHSPVAYREKLAETGAHAGAAIGGAYVGSLLVPATISTYKQWHHKLLTSKGAAVEKGDYLWKEGYYSKTALKDWEKTLVKSKFVSEAQKQVLLKGKGDVVWKKGFLEKGSGKVLTSKQQDFLRQDFYKRLYMQDEILRLRIDKLALPSQARQTQLGFKRFQADTVARTDLQLSEATRIQAAIKSNQYLGKWMTRPSLKPKADVGVSHPKFSHPEQYPLIDTVTGARFFESSYFRTGYYKPVPKLLLDYKPVGKVEMFAQRMFNIEYPVAPKVFVGKKGQLIHTDPSHIWEKGDIYTGLIPDKKAMIPTTPSIIEDTSFKFGFTPFIFEGRKEKIKPDVDIGLGIITFPLSPTKPVIVQEPKPEIIFKFDRKVLEPTKPTTEPILKIRTGIKQKQEATVIPFIDTPIVPDNKIPEIKIPDFVPEKEPPPPEPTPPFGFGWGMPSFATPRKIRGMARPKARARPKRRETVIDPFAGLYSVHVSQFAFGKATHPARTKEEKKKFKKRILGGAQFFPTVEMEEFNLKKLKI